MPGSGITISGWTKISFIDFPGMVSTVLFLSGCNLRCPWCHNPGIVRGTIGTVDFSSIKKFLEKRRDDIHGVVLSGGEPTIHAGLPLLVSELRAFGLRIKLDTNGLDPDMIQACRPDFLALDIKTTPHGYARLGSNQADAAGPIRRSIALVKSLGENAEVRITAVPGFIDPTSAAELGSMLSGVKKVWLQHYRNDVELLDPSFASNEPYPRETICSLKNVLEQFVESCSVRGNGAPAS